MSDQKREGAAEKAVWHALRQIKRLQRAQVDSLWRCIGFPGRRPREDDFERFVQLNIGALAEACRAGKIFDPALELEKLFWAHKLRCALARLPDGGRGVLEKSAFDKTFPPPRAIIAAMEKYDRVRAGGAAGGKKKSHPERDREIADALAKARRDNPRLTLQQFVDAGAGKDFNLKDEGIRSALARVRKRERGDRGHRTHQGG